jgi:hypothetical protein
MNPENMLKGRIAETLIEELLRQSGNIVYRFGYEAIVQNLVQLEESFDRNSEVGERIRVIPDFIVIDKDTIAYAFPIRKLLYQFFQVIHEYGLTHSLMTYN